MSDMQTSIDAGGKSVFASFVVGESEIALSVGSIQEVVNPPASYTAIPLAPAYVVGLFNLRGLTIPVIDLRLLLGQSSASEEVSRLQRVVIIEHGAQGLGILVDETREVISSLQAEVYVFDHPGESTKARMVDGVLKLDGGERIIQILAVAELFNLEDLPSISNQAGGQQALKSKGVRRQCVSFLVSGNICALDIADIREIVTCTRIHDVSLRGGFCLGAMDIRGSIVPVVDFSRLLAFSDQPADSNGKTVVVMQIDTAHVGLLVDSIAEIVNYFDEDVLPFPSFGGEKPGLFKGCLSGDADEAHIMLLEKNAILSNDELLVITRGHSQLFSSRDRQSQTRSGDESARTTLITFTVDARYALPIRQVQEVIDIPETLMSPPNSSRHIRGVFSLRGKLVTVLDSKSLSANADADAPPHDKLLVYEIGGDKFGLSVRSVDSIVQIAQADLLKMPALLSASLSSDTFTLGNAVASTFVLEQRTVGVLNLKSLTEGAHEGRQLTDSEPQGAPAAEQAIPIAA